MPIPKIKGNSGVTTKPYELYYDPRAGEVGRYTYKAAGGPNALLGLYNNAKAAGWNCRLRVSPVMVSSRSTS
ncbi:MAG: hypothetical protein ACTHLW_01085 [Verrucomicrobiota bacterium]